MKIVGHVFRLSAFLLNVLVAVGFLICAYSPYISPVHHPRWACAGLFFPIFLALNAAFCVFWLLVRKRYALFPLCVFLLGWGALTTYLPWQFTKADEPKGEVIKVLTYNTLGMHPEKDEEGKEVNPILDYVLQSDADIVCLQEFPCDNKTLKKELKKVYPYAETMKFSGGNGVGCFSRFPILGTKRIPYESANNGSGAFRLEFGQDTLLLVINHLESNKLDAHDKEVYTDMLKKPDEEKVKEGGKYLLHKLADAVAIRAPQADSVAKYVKEHPSKYTVVCGDFNDSPLSYAHRVIGEGLQDAFVERGSGVGVSYNRNHLYFRIDHLFASPAFRVLSCEVDNSIQASDHYPLWCLLEKKGEE